MMKNPLPTKGYRVSTDDLPFILNAQVKRSNEYTVQLYDADGDQAADTSNLDSLTLTVRSSPYDGTVIATVALTAVSASDGTWTLAFSKTEFDSLSWVIGESSKCLWVDFTASEGSLDYPVSDATGAYLFKLYVAQSIQGMGAS